MLVNQSNGLTNFFSHFARKSSLDISKVARGSVSDSSPKMAYLISRYPAVSHTFILREIHWLREHDFEIGVASINSPDRSAQDMSPLEIEESQKTYYVKKHGILGALLAHLSGLKTPLAYGRGLRYAMSLGGWNLKSILFGIFYFTEALMLARWMKANNYQHLHIHFATAAASVGLVLHSFYDCGLSFTVHGPDEFYDAKGQWLREKVEAVDFLVCIGRFARSQMMQLSPGNEWHKFEICPLGVDTEVFKPAVTKAHHDSFNILCVGRLTPAKGQRVLIEACQILRLRGRDFHLVIVGAGPDEEELKLLVNKLALQDYIQFTGPLNQERVQQCYALADAFALPSFSEGIPVVLMEAMASGIPCVTTRITGIPELIRDGIDGLLVTPSDEVELADALMALMDDSELCADLARAGRERVIAEYDININVQRLAEVFKRRLEQTAC